MRHLLLLLVMTVGAGCSFYFDLDSVDIPGSEDAGVDADIDAEVDMSEPEPECSLIDDACPASDSCAFVQETAELKCEPIEFLGEELDVPCESDADCLEQQRCIEWSIPDNRGALCSTPCSVATGEGCGLGEFCSRTAGLFPGDLGFCTPQCDLLDPSTCSSTELCVPDPYFVGSGFPPNARCFENADANLGGLGANCDPRQLNEAGCQESLTCLTVSFAGSVGSYCLQPCGDLSDCSTEINYRSCESIAGSSDVGYCSP